MTEKHHEPTRSTPYPVDQQAAANSEAAPHNQPTGDQKSPQDAEQTGGKAESSQKAETSGGKTKSPPASPPPPRGPKLWMILVALLIAGAALGAGVIWSDGISASVERIEAMLVGADAAAAAEADDGQYWTCGMHPWVILPEPGLCPICHMDLTPLDPAKLAGEIAIDPVTVQNIGVRIAPVTTGSLSKQVRTVGMIAYNEAAVRDVNTKIGGWIEQLHVDETGILVEQGAPLFELYSPELYAAQQEYLLAWLNRDRVGANFMPEAAQGSLDLLESARTRLEYFDISEAQIQRLQETGEPTKTLTINSPHTGVVTDKHANEGMRIEPGMRVFRIADLSTVWVMVTVYEQDLPYVEVGQQATMTLPYLAGETFEGEVAYIYPYLNEQGRQVRVRLEFPNPDGQLKPGMFATVRLDRTLDEQAVLVPRDAVVSTGERQVAFVSLGQGRFEPRKVKLGAETEGGQVQVLEGLEPDEQVVVSGQFLLDSEAKMRLAIAKMIEGEMASEQEPQVPVADSSELTSLPDPASEQLTTLLDAYTAIGDALAGDTLEGVDPQAQQIAEASEAMAQVEIPQQPTFWSEHEQKLQTLGEQASALAEASELEAARLAYAVLGDALDRLLVATGVPPSYDQPVHRFVCSMFADKPGDGVWLQRGSEPHNPLMGAASGMLTCHIPAEHRVLPVTGAESEEAASPAEPTQPESEAGAKTPRVAFRGDVPSVIAEAMNQVLANYLAVSENLVANTTEGMAPAAEELAAALDALVDTPVPDQPTFWQDHPEAATARGKALELAEGPELDQARLMHAGLSAALVDLFKTTGVPPSFGELLEVYSCPMFPPDEGGAVWLQPAGEARNPYMGEGPMLRCATEPTLLPASIEKKP